ncbi:hypothetical protein COT44_05025 [Candidatus Shapirobacteria bacterium CG08_land_8_20_14_0_20_39_18]|uniref:Uncharacterized protein n=1 Tax=Candidatus Shapirobacteria bacterium CG08_land_8_20_14_0_20_39_18 TaxID=1974883 RepID=A0A2M6XBU0_9BACT|nr:MAG: hypothetical protein COT44_05025 [Candidatus Shapirobacteria bacterium CG08_land_8_20_14_0_20_39_18]PJE68449.1 MAG: hypothetical protein COU94_01770 [Candidatus Shapirobacteria bacterium CG10_big_fil_rev_8_21_14_0_10_38_8]
MGLPTKHSLRFFIEKVIAVPHLVARAENGEVRGAVGIGAFCEAIIPIFDFPVIFLAVKRQGCARKVNIATAVSLGAVGHCGSSTT